MSCYLRHLNSVLAGTGIEVTRENRQQLDRAFHKVAGAEYKDCPATWKKLKQEWLADPARKHALAERLKKAWNKKIRKGEHHAGKESRPQSH